MSKTIKVSVEGADNKVIIIEIEGGCVINVSGIPKGYIYEIKDNDIDEEEKE